MQKTSVGSVCVTPARIVELIQKKVNKILRKIVSFPDPSNLLFRRRSASADNDLRTLVSRDFQSVFLKLPVQRGPFDSQNLSGSGLVALRLLQRAQNVLFFEIFDR